MPDLDFDNDGDREPALDAGEIFDSLAAQFPVCMASDEFHFFPQAKARRFDWSRWDDFSTDALANAVGRLVRWDHELGQHRSPPLSSAQTIDLDMLRRVIQTLRDQLALVRVYETQPTFYLTIVGMGLAEAFEAGSQALEARLRHLPAFLDQAEKNLDRVPRLFRDLGIDMLVKQRKWLDSLSLPEARRVTIKDAFDRLSVHLRKADAGEDFLPPVELYERIATHHMGCFLKPEDIGRELALEIAETRSILTQSAATITPGHQWQAVVDGLSLPQMPPGGAREIYRNAISDLARRLDAVDGITGILAAPHEFELHNGRACHRGRPVSLIFMDFNNDVFLKLHRRHDLTPLYQAIRENRVLNPRGTEPINVKSMFEVITGPQSVRFDPETVRG